MITEGFLNSCFSILLNTKSIIKKDRALYRDILEILEFYKSKENNEIPLAAQKKFECLTKICKLKLDSRTNDNIIDSVTLSKKYEDLSEFLLLKTNETVSQEVFFDNLKQIRLRKKIKSLFKNYNELTTVLDSIKDGSFESADDMILQYEEAIRALFLNMVESNRGAEIEATSSLDLVSDSYDSAVQSIVRKYEKENITPTGFTILDNDVLPGGFEPGRLYVFAGGSGAGKSTLLTNFVANAATQENLFYTDSKSDSVEGEIDKVFVYITAENLIDESLMRIFMAMFDYSAKDMINIIKKDGFGIIKHMLTHKMKKTNSTIVMKYFRPFTVTPFDLMGVLDDIRSTYGNTKIRGLYLDYLDLFNSDVNRELYRLELSHITSGLKTIGVEYEIPVITATQIGRSVYAGVTDASKLTLDLISEAIKKVEHSDFVSLQAKHAKDNTKILMNVGKNRSGVSDVPIEWIVNLSKFKFLTGKRSVNKEKQDGSNEKVLKFEGFQLF